MNTIIHESLPTCIIIYDTVLETGPFEVHTGNDDNNKKENILK